MPDMPWRFLHTVAKMMVKRNLDLQVEGISNLPPKGPVLIVSRHFHHLYDGCALLATLPRPLHILVGLDWVTNKPGRVAMEGLCRAAQWPVVIRQDGQQKTGATEAAMAFRHAARESLRLFHDGRILVVFPEGYPNIDPGYTPKPDESAFLPFQKGYLRLAELAARQGMTVPIVPAGFEYTRNEHWKAVLRFGEPLLRGSASPEAFNRDIEDRIRRLSGIGPS